MNGQTVVNVTGALNSYDSSTLCQFSGSAFGFTVKFGSSCAGVSNDFTGVCVLGTCN